MLKSIKIHVYNYKIKRIFKIMEIEQRYAISKSVIIFPLMFKQLVFLFFFKTSTSSSVRTCTKLLFNIVSILKEYVPVISAAIWQSSTVQVSSQTSLSGLITQSWTALAFEFLFNNHLFVNFLLIFLLNIFLKFPC